jgi:hypothetical protein
MVTVCVPVYVPATGENVGVATVVLVGVADPTVEIALSPAAFTAVTT